jgi:hypothetical protein
VAVFWNSGTALDAASPTVLPLPAEARPTAAAVINADADAAPEIAILASSGVFIADATATRSFEVGEPVVGELPGYVHLLVGDVDSDGLDDLLCGDGYYMFVFTSTPHQPRTVP